MPKYLSPQRNYRALDNYISGFRRIFLVCGSSLHLLPIGKHLCRVEELGHTELVTFSGFSPNPQWEEIEVGIAQFLNSDCDLIAAVGGGSAIDTAKCIRQSACPNLPLLAVPTTAGSGSEATHFAVTYRNGTKESVDCSLPDIIMLDPSTLNTLPEYQRKVTMLDALCHAVESFWSVNATPESMELSGEALRKIIDCYQDYLNNTAKGNSEMLLAAHMAGQAINIAQTTAGHAMCYKLTTLFKIAHGHAAALCVAVLWHYMLAHKEQCIHPRGRDYLEQVMEKIACDMYCSGSQAGAERFRAILNSLELETPVYSQNELAELTSSVNAERLKNFPISLSEAEIRVLYQNILNEK